MNPVSKIIIPFFALIVFGYVAARRNWVPPAAVPAFNGFLLYFAVPALLFRFASTAAFAEIMNGRFFIAYTVGSLVTLFLVVAFARGVMGARLGDASFYGLAASATNIGYLGHSASRRAARDVGCLSGNVGDGLRNDDCRVGGGCTLPARRHAFLGLAPSGT